ncbi:hypothetical protein FGB62_48g19 [Gracilaria domingensis]|nr:hypothetical protein FGB62_48g19 [Gracilaria domingensis]
MSVRRMRWQRSLTRAVSRVNGDTARETVRCGAVLCGALRCGIRDSQLSLLGARRCSHSRLAAVRAPVRAPALAVLFAACCDDSGGRGVVSVYADVSCGVFVVPAA